MTTKALSITILGAGITGLWQAVTLAKRGHSVQLFEKSPEPFTHSASALAGAMLAPYCEEEASEPNLRNLGLQSLALWRETYPDVTWAGTLVVAQPRDRNELTRFQQMTSGHKLLDANELNRLEPGLEGRFSTGLYFKEEGHINPKAALSYLLETAQQSGVNITFDKISDGDGANWIIDCRGLAAQDDLRKLRGVRGERIILHAPDVELHRTIRMLHPRFPLYIVPWAENLYMIGATVIESEAEHGMTLRSALELLSAAYALHPSFSEAEIIELGAGVRPAFPDNMPKIIRRGNRLYVNGLYRHGFLLAPVLAKHVADYLETGAINQEVFVADSIEW